MLEVWGTCALILRLVPPLVDGGGKIETNLLNGFRVQSIRDSQHSQYVKIAGIEYSSTFVLDKNMQLRCYKQIVKDYSGQLLRVNEDSHYLQMLSIVLVNDGKKDAYKDVIA